MHLHNTARTCFRHDCTSDLNSFGFGGMVYSETQSPINLELTIRHITLQCGLVLAKWEGKINLQHKAVSGSFHEEVEWPLRGKPEQRGGTLIVLLQGACNFEGFILDLEFQHDPEV